MLPAAQPSPDSTTSDPGSSSKLQPYAVVFSGGGALGSWEVGCLDVLWRKWGGPPRVRVGASAGALNAAALTAGMNVEELADLWKGLKPKDVYLEHPPGRGWKGVAASSWWATISKPSSAFKLSGWLGGATKVAKSVSSTFDSSPLEATLRKHLKPRWAKFRASDAVAVFAATDLLERQPHYFVRGASVPKSPKWQVITSFDLLIDSLMATSAIPILFPPRGRFVDGGVLRNQPLSAAARMRTNGEPIYVLLPHTDRLPNVPNLANLFPALLDLWLGAGLEHQLLLLGIQNTVHKGRGRPLIPVCLIRAGMNLEEISGLLKFGINVDQLIELGRQDAEHTLGTFDPNDPATWPVDVRPR